MLEQLVLLTGSNIGDRKALLDQALGHLSTSIGSIMAVSSVYESEPWGFSSEDLFLNQAVICSTELSPFEVIAHIIHIEHIMGRSRNGSGYASRSIDIDILYYGSQVIEHHGLIIPHPRLHLRRFALEPLCELMPDFEHPLLHKTNLGLLRSLNDSATVKRIAV